MTQIEPQGIPVEEKGRIEDDTLTVQLRTAMARREERVLERVGERLAKLTEPDRSSAVAEVLPKGEPDERVRQVRAVVDYRYDRMPENVRRFRSPETDHWMAQWIRALTVRDQELMKLADANLSEKFGRADTLVGTPDAGGGISSGTGGPLIPVPLLGVIEIERDAVAKIRGLASPFELTAAQARIPTAGAVTVAMVAEGTTSTGDEPPFASKLPVAHKMQAGMKASVEAVADSAFNLVGIYASRAGRAMGAEEDVQFCTTDGIAPNVSEKIDDGATNVPLATVVTLDYAQMVTNYFALPQQYRMNAAWFGSGATLTILSSILDGNGRPIFSPGAGLPGVITDDSADGVVFRKPVYEVPLADGVLVFGEMRSYGVGTRAGITARVSEHASWSADLIEYKFTQRLDGIVLDAGAFVESNGITTAG